MKNIYNYFFVTLMFVSMCFTDSNGAIGFFCYLLCVFSGLFLVLNNKEEFNL